MSKRRLSQREVSEFLGELRQAGATNIRRQPADSKGLVEIRWDPSELEQRQYVADMQAWRLPMVLSALVAAIIVAALILITL